MSCSIIAFLFLAQMDRRWISNGRPFSTRLLGINEFLSFVKEIHSDDSIVLCPCMKCLNRNRIQFSDLKRHLLLHKFSSTYLRWTHHGEPSDLVIIGDEHNDGNGGHEDDYDGNGGHVDANDDNGGHEDDNDDNVGHMDMDDEGQSDGEANEFEAMLKDLARAPDEAEGEGGQDKAFESLLEESKRPLYPGNKHVGRFALVVKLLHHKS